jgi:hypothetical protein
MKNIIEKIDADIFERSIKHNFKLFPKMGKSTHEFNYRKCKSPIEGLENYFFVVSEKLYYNNGGLVDFKKEVYAYDENGEYVTDESVYKKCRGGFFKKLINI